MRRFCLIYLLPAGLTTRAALDNSNSESATHRVLFQNFGLAAALGFSVASLTSLFAVSILVMFGGPVYAASLPLLRVLSFAMALLALLQILATLHARAQSASGPTAADSKTHNSPVPRKTAGG
jgi:predicted membrane protein